jgi:MFS family permease
MEISPVKKYGTLLSLYIAQSIPMSFFSTVVPVIMRQEEYSLASIGLLQLVKIPWIIKFFWAPLVDKTSHSLRDYKKWIFFSELFYALIILSTGFFKLSTDFSTIVILMVAAFVLSATQDIASDALAIRILRSKQRGFGNSMQAAGSFLGTMVGSGVLLMLYPKIGWQGLTILLAGFRDDRAHASIHLR